MADLNSKKPSATFHSLLKVGTTDNQILDGTLRIVEDGRGNNSALKISTGAAQVDNIKVDGNTITSENTDGHIALTPNGTGDVQIGADTVRVGDNNADAIITTYGTGDLTLSTNEGSSSGIIEIEDGTGGDIKLTPAGTRSVVISKADINGGTIDGTTVAGSTGSFTTLGSSALLTASQGILCEDELKFTVTTFSTAGPSDAVDVADISMLKLDTSSNSVVIGGLRNGVAGQVLFIVKTSGANRATLEHNEGGGNQNIYLQSVSDETIGVAGIKASNPMGGWMLVCDGSHWYSIGR